MSLAITVAQLTKLLERDLEWMNENEYEIGLFKNDLTPTSLTVMADIVPANYGGYSGQQPVVSWPISGLPYVAPRVVGTHPSITWTANGASTNTIYGYYVQNTLTEELMWAERRATGGILVGAVAGQTYIVVPVYSRRSEFNSA